MHAFWKALFSGDGFMPHGHCYLWTPGLVWLHVVSDISIGLAYVAISATLVYLVWRGRREMPFHGVFLAFGVFIVACGGTHFMDAWTVWTPVYWLAGAVKVVTALASVTTAVALPPLVPVALNLLHDARLTRERQAKALDAVLSAVPAAVWIAHDPGCGQITGNPTAAALLRLPPDANQSLTAPAGEEPGHFRVFRNGLELAPEELPVQRAARGAEIRDFEEEIRFDDGSRRYLYGNATPLRDGAGGIYGAVAAFVDITERHRAEAALQVSEERLRLFIEHAPAAIAMFDCDMRYLAASRRWLTDYGLSAEILGRSHYDVFPEISEAWKAVHARCLAGAVEGADEDRFERADGSVQWIHWEIHPWRAAAGEIGGIVIFSEEITARKEAELRREELLRREQAARSEAERAVRMKDEFLATLSHELRTPLTAILGWTHLLRRGARSAEDLARGIATIERNARLQTHLVDDLLDMSRIVSGKLRLDPQPVSLPAVIEAALDTLRPSAEARGIRLTATLAPLPGPLLGDPARLQQIVWNLVSNAIKFTPPGGQVTVQCTEDRERGGWGDGATGRRGDGAIGESSGDEGTEGRGGGGNGQDGGGAVTSSLAIGPVVRPVSPSRHPPIPPSPRLPSVLLTVTDSGIGIPAEFLPHVFDRFRQADSSATRPHGGLGLGLAIVQRLVELHGGTVWAESPGEGQGATFTVSLPLSGPPAETPGEAPPRWEATPAELPSLRGLRVLVVDDEPDARELVARLLAECDGEVTTAASTTEALARLRSASYDVLVGDLGMPELDGFELIRRVRALPADAGGEVPALALTAFARSEDRVLAVRAGYQEHVAKPVEPAELVARVARVAGRGEGGSPRPAAGEPPSPPEEGRPHGREGG